MCSLFRTSHDGGSRSGRVRSPLGRTMGSVLGRRGMTRVYRRVTRRIAAGLRRISGRALSGVQRVGPRLTGDLDPGVPSFASLG